MVLLVTLVLVEVVLLVTLVLVEVVHSDQPDGSAGSAGGAVVAGQCGPVRDCSVSEHTAARQDVLATALTQQTDDRHVQLASHTSGGPH